MFFYRPENRFLDLIPREESEDPESSVPRLILKRQNTPSDDSTPPKVCIQLHLFKAKLHFIAVRLVLIRCAKKSGTRV